MENYCVGFNSIFIITAVLYTPPKPVDPVLGALAGPCSPEDNYSYVDNASGKKVSYNIKFKDNNVLYMYNAIRLFFPEWR